MKKFNSNFTQRMGFTAVLLTTLITACGDGGGSGVSAGARASSGPAGGVCQGASCVSLGTAVNYAILAKTGVSTVPASLVTGNVGLSPAAGSLLTGWSETKDVTATYSTSAQVVAPGKLYAADYVGGSTSSDLTTAVGDMETAYTAAAGKAPGLGLVDLYSGNIGGQTLTAGVYKWNTGVTIPTNVTLSGSATDVWVFQIAGGLTQAAATSVILSNGALAKNIFWQVAGGVTLGAAAHFEGIILSQTAIVIGNTTSVNGRLLAQTAVTLDANAITQPAP